MVVFCDGLFFGGCHHRIEISALLTRVKSVRTLLIIDDDPIIRKLALFAFGKLGQFFVQQASSGEMGLERLNEGLPDVVILDVMMPAMDGPATFALIRAKYPKLPIIFLTGQETDEQLAKLRSLGPAGILAKPFDPKTIGRAVHNILDGLSAT